MESLGKWGSRTGARGALIVAATISWAVLGGAGCGGGGHGSTKPDADAAAVFDAKDAPGESVDVRTDAPAIEVATCGVTEGGAKKAAAATCGCDADCLSGHCVDGVCCNTACKEACKTCSATG